jgi:hypothetical protein
MSNDPDYDDGFDDYFDERMAELANDASLGVRMGKYERLDQFPEDNFDIPPDVKDKWGWVYENHPEGYASHWKGYFESPLPYEPRASDLICEIMKASHQ